MLDHPEIQYNNMCCGIANNTFSSAYSTNQTSCTTNNALICTFPVHRYTDLWRTQTISADRNMDQSLTELFDDGLLLS